MKKHTSKSVSATPKASLPSGTSAKTGVTASKTTNATSQNQFAYLVVTAKKRTPEQARQAMIRAGLLTESGDLAEQYKVKPKQRRKSGK